MYVQNFRPKLKKIVDFFFVIDSRIIIGIFRESACHLLQSTIISYNVNIFVKIVEKYALLYLPASFSSAVVVITFSVTQSVVDCNISTFICIRRIHCRIGPCKMRLG